MHSTGGFTRTALEIGDRNDLQVFVVGAMGQVLLALFRLSALRQVTPEAVDLLQGVVTPSARAYVGTWPFFGERQLSQVRIGNAHQPGRLRGTKPAQLLSSLQRKGFFAELLQLPTKQMGNLTDKTVDR